ncbi:hypothetical protein HDU91_005112 [Kappamyces sp. JEL0680]|nr:hypothetical protein HDU91_005112 [Kappamyces sp. JEL0680]
MTRRSRQPPQPTEPAAPDAPQQEPQAQPQRQQVRGPTSALTSFLRERGIRPPSHNPYQRIPREQQLNPSEPVPEQPQNTTVPVASSSGEALAQVLATQAPFKKSKKCDDSDDDLIAGPSSKKPKVSKVRPQGKDPALLANLVRFCTSCNRRFVATSDPEQSICLACQTVTMGGKKPSAAQKRALKKAQDLVLQTTGYAGGSILPLRDLCIRYIVENIDLVEDSFTFFAPETKQKISRIISKQRKLTNASLPLFLGPQEDIVQLFDCTYLDEDALLSIPELCPELRTLQLGYCGRMTDAVLEALSRLKFLSSISLHGPFLCSPGGFAGLFQSLSLLSSVELEFATKLTNDSLLYLARECPGLEALVLTDCPHVDDAGLGHLAALTKLSKLGLNNTGTIQDEAVVELLRKVGGGLEDLSLNKQPHLTKPTLDAVAQHCSALKFLSLQHCPSFDKQDMTCFFAQMQPLTKIDMTGNNIADNLVVAAIINGHAGQLSHLSLNGLDEITVEVLGDLTTVANLTFCDFSWIRAIDDIFLQSFLSVSKSLERLKVFGCNQLSIATLNAKWINNRGRQVIIQGNEFD